MIIGRKEEKELLANLLSSNSSSFLALYGRRRVGKTYLIRNYFQEIQDEVLYISYTGSLKLSTKSEISSFSKNLNQNFNLKNTAKDWNDVFNKLKNIISLSQKSKKVIFLDEIPWLDKRNSSFLNELHLFWDTFASIRNDVILIVSGSSGSWMNKMIFEDTGSLYNRVLHKMKIKPFSLQETLDFFENIKNISFTKPDTLKLYFYYGGIPYYLNKYKPLASIDENIKSLDDTFYQEELDSLIDSIYGQKKGHIQIIKELVNKKSKKREDLINFEDLSKKTYERSLQELVNSDFVHKVKSIYNKKEERYIIADEFLQNFFNRDLNNSLFGTRFEKVILKHINKVLEFLKEDSADIFFDFNKDSVQIDLIIVSKTTCYIFEIKHYQTSKVLIDKDYLEKLEKRTSVIKKWLLDMDYSQKEIKIGFISLLGLSNSQYSRSFLDFTIKDLF